MYIFKAKLIRLFRNKRNRCEIKTQNQNFTAEIIIKRVEEKFLSKRIQREGTTVSTLFALIFYASLH